MVLFADSEIFLGDFGHVPRSPGVDELQIKADVGALPLRPPHREQVQITNGWDSHVGHKGYVVVGNGLWLPHAIQVTLAAVQIVLLTPTKNNLNNNEFKTLLQTHNFIIKK